MGAQIPPISAHVVGFEMGAGGTQHSAAPSLNIHPPGLCAAIVPPPVAHWPAPTQIPPCDSHTAADLWTGSIRQALQSRFGAAEWLGPATDERLRTHIRT